MTAPLDPVLRRQLEKAVRSARAEGEAGARAALRALAVDAARPHESMSAEERGLRRRLRAHGRQLGDARDRGSGAQEIGRLAHEVAYEHWHRMLFARFLAENGLLVESRSGVSVSLDECAELAREGGATNGWQVAEEFAAGMLPRIFRPDDPALAVTLAPEVRQGLERLVGKLPAEVFAASDALGWTYQYWQADRKNEVNAAGTKIGPDELPAVTQLFTESYMVRFLFHNTIGAWRAGKLLADRPALAGAASSEAELAAAVRIEARGGLDGYDFEYLRFVREPADEDNEDAVEGSTGPWRPAAGVFRRWPRRAADLRVLDPCCGSGHFLVEGLELLVRLRMEEEDLEVEAAVGAVLRDNLFGLEIDQRCTQIAAFNLALAAWKLVGRPIELPPLQVACTGLSVSASRGEWLKLAEGEQALEGALDRLYGLFAQAAALGSLLDPRSVDKDLYQADYATAERALSRAIAWEDADDEVRERAVAAQGISRAARILVGEFDLVVTNVPYLGRGKQAEALRSFLAEQHPDAKADLATAFVSRGLSWLGGKGAQALVVPQIWLFLRSYRKLRERLLDERRWRLAARLGTGAFETISGEVVNVALVVLSGEAPAADGRLAGIDVSAPRGQRPVRAREKAELLRADDCARRSSRELESAETALGASRDAAEEDPASGSPSPRSEASSVKAEPSRADSSRGTVVLSRQRDQRSNPNAVLLQVPLAGQTLLGRYAYGHQGIATADYACFGRKFWEMPDRGSDWEFQQSTIRRTRHMGGREHVLHWKEGEGPLQQSEGVRIQGGGAWNRDGIAVAQMGPLPVTRYTGEYFDNNVAVLTVTDPEHLPAVWCFCSSDEYGPAIRQFDQKLNVTNANLVNAPFDLDRWRRVAAESYPNGLPEPYSDDPTQWLFHGHPCGSVVWDEKRKRTAHGPLRADASVLHVAVARLLGYRWPAERDAEMRLAAEAREWVERCRELDDLADADGIVCLHAAAGEARATERLRALLRASYGEEWSDDTERRLLAAGAGDRRSAPSLGDWLRDRFFAEHCKRFHDRPFVWHIWDGRKDGFHALVNCHRLCGPEGEGRRTLEALAYRHLGEWTGRQRAAQSQDEEGADARLAAALDLQRQLEFILKGEPPYDIFVRWRPLHEQPLGWAPYLDDGVRLNIRPFMRAELQSGGRKGAGILRVKPNIGWKKDRGTEPESHRPRDDFPWFHSCPGQGAEADRTDWMASPDDEYDGIRWNDLHYTRDAKEAARTRHEVGTRRDAGTKGREEAAWSQKDHA